MRRTTNIGILTKDVLKERKGANEMISDEELIAEIWKAKDDWPRQAIQTLNKRDKERDALGAIWKLNSPIAKDPQFQAAVLEELVNEGGPLINEVLMYSNGCFDDEEEMMDFFKELSIKLKARGEKNE